MTLEEFLKITLQVQGEKDVRALSAAFTEAGKAAGLSEEQISGVLSELTKIGQARDAINTFTRTKAELNGVSKKLAEARTGLANLNEQFDRSDRSSGAVNKAFRAAEKAVADLTTQEERLSRELNRSSAALTKAGIDSNNLAAADRELAAQLDRVGGQLQEVSAQAGKTEKNVGLLERATTAVGKGFTSAREAVTGFASNLLRITGIAGAVSAALGALSVTRIFGGAIASARSFEAVLSEVQAVSGATTEQLVRMREASEEASSTTKFTAEEAAAALGELARASGDADAAIAQLPPTLNLAQAGGLDAARSAEILTTALTQFGLEATDAARVADLLTREANSTQDTVEKLGLAMSYVAPLARQFGMSIEDATALLGALAEQGFRGERAGTALRNVFSALLDPASKFSRALRSLGIDGNDFIGVISELSSAGDEGRKAILALDAEARPAILALVKSGGEGIRRLQEDFRNAAGEAERTAQAIGANFEGASSRFTSALDFLRRALVEPILGPLAKEFDSAAQSVRAFVATADFKALARTITDFAVTATRAVFEFVRSIDFSAVVRGIQDFTASATSFFEDIKGSAQGTANVLRGVGNGISLFWNALKTGVFAIGTAVSAALYGLGKASLETQKLLFALSGQTQRMSKYLADAEVAVGGLKAVMDKFVDGTIAGANGVAAAWNGVVSAVNSTADAAGQAAPKLEKPGQAIQKTGDAATSATVQLGAYTDASDQAAQKARESEQAHINQQAALIAARDSVRALKDQLLELVKSGKGSADEMQRLQSAIAAAEAEVKRLTPSAKGAAEAAQQLRNAFADLGVVSQEELRKTADLARTSFDTIVSAYRSGQAAIEDVVRSFAVYAEAERAASDASSASEQARVESLLASKAAALGLTTELERAGVIGRQAGEETAASMRDAKEAIDGVADAASNMAASQAEAKQEAQQVNNTIITMTLLTEAQQQALKQLGQDWRAGRLDAQAYAEAVTRAMADSTDSIEEQIEATERATEALREMRAELQDEADRASGNEVDIENRRYQEQLQRIRELEEQGGAAARREAAEVRRLADEEHRRRLEEIRAEARARRNADREEAAQAPRPSGGSGGGSGGSGGGGLRRELPIIVNVHSDLDIESPAGRQRLAAKMLDPLVAELRRYRRDGGNL